MPSRGWVCINTCAIPLSLRISFAHSLPPTSQRIYLCVLVSYQAISINLAFRESVLGASTVTGGPMMLHSPAWRMPHAPKFTDGTSKPHSCNSNAERGVALISAENLCRLPLLLP